MVQWFPNPMTNGSQWEISIKSLALDEFNVVQKPKNGNLRARISASESGIALPYSNFTQITALLDYL